MSLQPLSRVAFAVAFVVWGGSVSSAPQASAAEASSPPNPAAKNEGEAKEAERWHREGFVLKKGQSRIELVGYVQEDFRRFDWNVLGDETGAKRNPGHKLRRTRIGSKARFGDLSLIFVIDPRNSQKGSRLKDVTAGYEFSMMANLLAGYFKPSIGQEFLTSSSKTDFVDRNMAANMLSPDRDWGVELSGSSRRVGYAVGGFAGDGNSHPQSSGASGTARLILKPVKGLELAGSILQGEVTADPLGSATPPAPKGNPGKTATGFAFWQSPHVNGTRRRLGSDLSYSRGPFKLQAEYLETREQRKGQGDTGLDIPDVLGRGWNVQASYVLTGESKGSTVEPTASLFKGGRGALEVVARVESLKFDDTGPSPGVSSFSNRASNISPAGSSAIQVGANYWTATFMKIQASALWESYEDPRIAPVPGDQGRYLTLIARLHFIIP
ncbi:MAG: hypothetical protein JJE39_05930 [Vicinamibacteria bacterium]|nr:hypothetical protein [Vicinamibacteria bacterium]